MRHGRVIGWSLALLAFAGAGGRPPGAAAAPGPRPAAAPAGRSAVQYAAPVPAPWQVQRPFDPPSTPYGPGHRGVDLRLAGAAVVRSAGAGVVQFAGPVAGRGVVVVAHADGVRTEYEPVQPLVRAGAAVARGQPIAHLAGRHAGCAVSCLHWGARRGADYFDPLALLRPLGPVVLLPWSPG